MSRVIAAFTQMFDSNGDPLANGWLRFLQSGTNNTLKNTYADVNLSLPNANPLQLDAEGRVPNVFGQGTYRIDLFYDNPVTHVPGELVQSFDPVTTFDVIEGAGGNFAEWQNDVVYQVSNIVIYNGRYYRSITADNLGNAPDTNTDQWEEITFLRYYNPDVVYQENDIVISGSALYFSLADLNQGNDPFTNPAWWDPVGAGTVLLNWEEWVTTFRPVNDGYNIGDDTHHVGSIYLDEFAFFPVTPSSLPTLDYEISNKIYTDETAALRMRWIGDWTPATYEINDVVRDDNWTMVAIAQTSDRPAPQPAGDNLWVRDAFSPPAFSETSDSQPALFIGQRYEFTPAFTVRTIRIKLPSASIGDDVEVWMVYNSTTDPSIVNVLPSLTIGADQVEKWVTLTIGSQYVASGSFIDFIMVLRPGTGPLTFTYEWDYVRANGDPSSGQIYHQGGLNADQIRVHEEDSGAVDRTLDLDNIVAGSKITMDSQDYTWEVLQASKTGDVYTFIVDPSARAGAETSDFTFTYYAATPIYYVYNTDLFLSDARISGYYATEYDPSNATYLNNNGYGIDIEVQNMISSDDWEVVAAPFGTVSGGTGSQLVNWEESDTVLRPVVSGAGQLGDATHLIDGLYLGDGSRVWFGSSQQMNLYHSGGNAGLTNTVGDFNIGNGNTGNLNLKTDGTNRWAVDGSTGDWMPILDNTFSIGDPSFRVANIYTVDFFPGQISMADNAHIYLGDGQDLDIFFDGTNSNVLSHAGDLVIGTTTASDLDLRTDNTLRWLIDGSTGNLIPSGAYNIGDTSNRVNGIFTDVIDLPDNGVARFGNLDDLQIYHDGTNSYIENNTGALVIQENVEGQVISFRTNDGVSIINRWYVGPEGDIRPAAPNAYSLGNSTALIDDIYQGDNGKHYFGNDQDMEISHGGNNGFITNGTGQLIIQNYIGNTNDITFRTNGVDRWFIDGSTGALTPSGANTFNIGSTTNEVSDIYQGDNDRHYFGNDQDFFISHSGSNAALNNGTGQLTIGNGVGNTGNVRFQTDATIRWYIDGSSGDFLPFADNTYNIGSDALRPATIYSYNLNLPDNGIARFGDSGDFQIQFTGSGAFLDNYNASAINIRSNNSSTAGRIYLATNSGAGVANRWVVLNTGDLLPSGNGVYNFGATASRVSKVWTVDLESTNMPTVSGVDIIPDQTGQSGNFLSTNGSNTVWTSSVSASTAQDNIFFNPFFTVWQRGAGSFTVTNQYTADGIRMHTVGTSATVDRVSGTTINGYTDTDYGLQFSHTIGSAAGDYARIMERIDDVTILHDTTVTINVVANIPSGSSMAVSLRQNFGTGGSSEVQTPSSSHLVGTGSVQVYTVSVTLPSISGQTIGTDSSLRVVLWADAGTDANTETGSLGHQPTGSSIIYAVQVRQGSRDSIIEIPSQKKIWDECYWYFIRHGRYYSDKSGYFTGRLRTTTLARMTIPSGLTSNMRVYPTIDPGGLDWEYVWGNTVTGLASVTTIGTEWVDFTLDDTVDPYTPVDLRPSNAATGWFDLSAEL